MEKRQSMALFGIVVIGAITIGVIGLTNTPSSGLSANMIDDKQRIMGHAVLTALDPQGNIIAYRQTDNLITNAGDDCAAKLTLGTTPSGCVTVSGQGVFKNIAIGTSSASLAVGNTALNTEQTSGFTTPASGDRIASTQTTTVAAGNGDTTVMTATFVTNAGMTIQEAGIFDTTGTSTGNLFARQGFVPIQLLSGDSLGITWTVTIR